MMMIQTQQDLKNAIQQLQEQRLVQKQAIQQQFYLTYQSLKPVNLVKHMLQEISGSTEIKNTVLETGIGLGTGILSKSLFVGASRSFIKQVLGNVLQYGVTNLVTSHPSIFKNVGKSILKFIKNDTGKKGRDNSRENN